MAVGYKVPSRLKATRGGYTAGEEFRADGRLRRRNSVDMDVSSDPIDASAWAEVLQQRNEQQAAMIADAKATAEGQHQLNDCMEQLRGWRARAEAAEKRLAQVVPLANASCTACEEMLSRLAQAKSLADLSDLSRKAFEVRTTMMSIEERARAGLNESVEAQEAFLAASPSRNRASRRQPSRSPSPPPNRPQQQQQQQPRQPPRAGRRAAQAPGGVGVGGAAAAVSIPTANAGRRGAPPQPPPQQQQQPIAGINPPTPASWAAQQALTNYYTRAGGQLPAQQPQQQQWGGGLPSHLGDGGYPSYQGMTQGYQHAMAPMWSQPQASVGQLLQEQRTYEQQLLMQQQAAQMLMHRQMEQNAVDSTLQY